MQELTVKIAGIVPLMMHSNQTVDQFNPYAQAIKSISSKRKKTDADLLEMGRLEWESGLYIEAGKIVIPEKCLFATIWNAAKRFKLGKKVQEGLYVADPFVPLDFPGARDITIKSRDIPNPDLDKLYTAEHIDRRVVKVQRNSVVRERPIFEKWGCEFSLIYDEKTFDRRTVEDILETAGIYTGLMEMRPRLGRFKIVDIR